MDLFNFIKNNLDIVTVITEYTHLKKTGSQYWKALCPFHHEKTPSFTVSPHKQIFYCFGCHQTGDVISFIEKVEHISALEAAQLLTQRYGLQVPESTEFKNHQKTAEKTATKLCYIVAQWCHAQLWKSTEAQHYVISRRVSEKAVKQYMIGYFPQGQRAVQELLSHVLKQGFSSQELLQEHILFQNKNFFYSPFEGRIIFPIRDHVGQVCGFGGRIFLPEDDRPKYYNSKESAIFKKGKMLFGLDVAKLEIQKQKTAFIVEGYTDCVAMYQHGYENVVATLGTACTQDHLKILAKHAQTMYVLYDSDTAGKQAILRLVTLCWQLDLDMYVVLLPEGYDPALMLEKEIPLTEYIDQAADIFTYFVKSVGSGFQTYTMKEKIGALSELLDLIMNVADELKQNILLLKVAELVQVPLEVLKKEYEYKMGQQKVKVVEKQKEAQLESHTTEMTLEEQLVGMIFYDPSVVSKSHETILAVIDQERIKTIIDTILKYRDNIAMMEKELGEDHLSYARSLSLRVEGMNIKHIFHNVIMQFQKKYWKSLVSHIKIKIMQARQSHNKQEVIELIELFEKMKKDLYKNGSL